jgi:hypothetical protein
MRRPIARAPAGFSTWIAMCVLGAASFYPANAADGVIVSVMTSCEAMVKDACQGAYGFRIDESGAFVAGPSPEGHARSGQAVETRLFVLARRALANPANSKVACPSLGPIPGTRETVTVNQKDTYLVLKGDAGTMDPRCDGSIAGLAELFGAADAAMRRHYPTPFR